MRVSTHLAGAVLVESDMVAMSCGIDPAALAE